MTSGYNIDNMQFHTKAFRTKIEREEAAELPLETRLQMINTLLYEHPKFLKGMEFLQRFHMASPKLGIANVGSIGGVIGQYRSGKSYLVKNYLRKFPSLIGEHGKQWPVLYAELREEWDAKELPCNLLTQMGRPPQRNLSPSALNTKALDRMGQVANRLVVLDDPHVVLNKHQTKSALLGFIKDAAERQVANVLLIGPPVIQKLIEQRDELRYRGNFPHFDVPSFDPKTKIGEEFYSLFLAGVDDRLPFRKSSGLAEIYYDELVRITNASIVVTMNMVTPAALLALEDDSDCIQAHHFRTVIKDQSLGKYEAEE